MFFFFLFGPGARFLFAVWAGDGSSLTYRSAWLLFKRPNNQKDQTAKKKHGFPFSPAAHGSTQNPTVMSMNTVLIVWI